MATPIPNTRINCLPCLASFITLFLAILACIPPFAVGQSSDSSPPAVTPSAFTTIVGESATFTVVDSSGRPVSDAQWSVDPPLAELTVENGEAVLTPNQAGRAIVTANFGNQSASASLLILSGPSLPQGTVRWSVLPTPGYETLFAGQTEPSDSEMVFYSVEWSPSANAILRAFTESGQQLWMTRLSSSASPATLKQTLPPAGETFLNQQPITSLHDLFPTDGRFAANTSIQPNTLGLPADGKAILLRHSGDGFAGLLLLERGRFRDSLVDIGPADGGEVWRFRSEGRLNKNWTVNHNGDVAIVETLYKPPYSALLVLDGKTGAVRFKIPFPDSSTTINGFRCKDPIYNVLKNTRPSVSGSVFTSTDSNMYVQVETHIESTDLEACQSKQYAFDDTLSLLRVSPDGQTEWKTFQHIHADGAGAFHVQPRVFAGESIPDGFGGVLAAWTYLDPKVTPGKPLHTEARLSVISPNGQRDYTLPMPFWTPGLSSFFDENMVLGEGNNALIAVNGPQLVRFDHVAGEVSWVRHPPTGSVKIQHSTAGGGVLISNAGRLIYFDVHGNGVELPWTVAVSNPEDVGLVQSDPFDHTALAPIALRELNMTWRGGTFIAVEDGAPYGKGALLQFVVR